VALSFAPPTSRQITADSLTGEASGDAKLTGFQISETYHFAQPSAAPPLKIRQNLPRRKSKSPEALRRQNHQKISPPFLRLTIQS
jgi:hypothetical protein